MQNRTPVPLRRSVLGGIAVLLARPALAQGSADWPNQTVRFINLYAPGGANDVACRIWGNAMSALTGQQFVVESRTGAGGTVGTLALARSPNDGYTLGLGSVATLAIAPHLYASLQYDPVKDFTYITGLYRQPNLIFVNNDLPARSIPELIDLLRANPGKYTYATGGAGTTPHLAMELFKARAGLEIPLVTYRGGAPALIDLMAGRVQVMCDNLSGPIGAVRDGKVRALAVTSLQRSPAAPEIPTMDSILPGFDVTSWNGLAAPAGLPPALVERINALSRRALANPELVAAYQRDGNTPWPTSAEDYATYRARQSVMFAEVVKQSGARIE